MVQEDALNATHASAILGLFNTSLADEAPHHVAVDAALGDDFVAWSRPTVDEMAAEGCDRVRSVVDGLDAVTSPTLSRRAPARTSRIGWLAVSSSVG